MNETFLQFMGYGASLIIAMSMTMSSIVKFRWINLAGAVIFGVYGLLIGAIPVMILNSFIISVDIFYLIRIYNKKELFDFLEIRGDNKYLLKLLEFHKEDIEKSFPGFVYKPELNTISFLVLRNTAIAGVFLAHKEENNILKVGLDYVVPQYRDYKNGKYIYHHLREGFIKTGIKQVATKGYNTRHIKYLKKLQFKENDKGLYVKVLKKI